MPPPVACKQARCSEAHKCLNVVTYRLASPPRQAGPPTCSGTEAADIHPGTRRHSSRNRFKGGLAATSNLSGWGGVAQICTFPKGGKKTGASKNSPLHTHSVPGESQLCLTKCREEEDGGGCAAIQPYGSKHLLHRARRGGIKKAESPLRSGSGLGFHAGTGERLIPEAEWKGGEQVSSSWGGWGALGCQRGRGGGPTFPLPPRPPQSDTGAGRPPSSPPGLTCPHRVGEVVAEGSGAARELLQLPAAQVEPPGVRRLFERSLQTAVQRRLQTQRPAAAAARPGRCRRQSSGGEGLRIASQRRHLPPRPPRRWGVTRESRRTCLPPSLPSSSSSSRSLWWRRRRC